ncbi:MAG: hypothetical protein ABI986_09190 [Chloroflexota bacterium]
MKINKISSLIFIFMLFGCNSINALTATPVIQPSIKAFTALPSLAPTVVTPIPSATKHAEADLPEGCINLMPTTLNPLKIDGLFVTGGYLFDPQTWQKVNLADGGQQLSSYYPVSPNKKYMLASVRINDREYYYVLKTPGKVSKIDIPIPEGWIFSWWSDNEHIVFYTLEPDEYLNSWNPFTGEVKRIKLDVPNAVDQYFAPGLYLVHAYSDPTLERVFYGSKDGRLILWNLETKKEIASLPMPMQAEGSSAEAFFPVFGGWSPEGKKLITPWPIWFGNMKPPANELYVFDADGNISQLTDLNQKYTFANAEEPVWSPDGRQVGFWLRIGDSNSKPLVLHQWLAVFDTNTKETNVYCLATGIPEHPGSDIIWSPNDQQLIVNIELPNGNYSYSPILVDLIHQTQSVLDLPDLGGENKQTRVGEWIVR